MGKGKFDCFEGHKRCETVTFTDSNGNSFSMKVYQRSYDKGIALFAWESATVTFNGTPSVGPFTGSKQALECGFKSDMTMTSYRHPVLFSTILSAVVTNSNGYLSFNSSGYPTFTIIGTVPDASSVATVFGGGATYPQD